MDALVIALTVVVTCAVTVLVTFLVGRRFGPTSGDRRVAPDDQSHQAVDQKRPEIPVDVADVLDALHASSLVVGVDDSVLRASAGARLLGLVHGDRVGIPELVDLVRRARSRGDTRSLEFDVVRPPIAGGTRRVNARVAPLRGRMVLVIADDVTDARRLDAVRRDFVANVSHELKTPTGALSLLAEAVSDASNDPAAVRRFSARMLHESRRLSEMVTELIELSRVQDAEPLPGVVVRVELLIAEAIDSTRLAAATRQISVTVGEGAHAVVRGDRGQLVAALRNLLANAIAYSPAGTRVALAVKESDGFVEISVTDQGMGIPHDDIERIFERFYRVDAARSRETGGTGLGLAIVKHVCANHGGDVRVWSREGEGSTFTIRLPAPDQLNRASGPESLAVVNPDDPSNTSQFVSEVST